MTNGLMIGDRAPDFTASCVRGENMTLSSKVAERPVLLYFYPMNYGGACSAYMEKLNESYDEFDDIGVEVFHVNPGSLEEHSRWMDRTGSRHDIISDTGQRISKDYGMVITSPEHQELYGFTDRGLVLVDGDMTIRYIWRADRPSEVVDLRPLIDDICRAVGRCPRPVRPM